MLSSIRLSDLVMKIEYQVSATRLDMSDPSPPRQIVYKSIQFSHFLFHKAYCLPPNRARVQQSGGVLQSANCLLLSCGEDIFYRNRSEKLV